MIELELKPYETAYKVVEKLVRKHWEYVHEADDAVVNVKCSYDGRKWEGGNQFAEFTGYNVDGILWLRDWWEGEPHIRVYGIKNLSELRVIGGMDGMEV